MTPQTHIQNGKNEISKICWFDKKSNMSRSSITRISQLPHIIICIVQNLYHYRAGGGFIILCSRRNLYGKLGILSSLIEQNTTTESFSHLKKKNENFFCELRTYVENFHALGAKCSKLEWESVNYLFIPQLKEFRSIGKQN